MASLVAQLLKIPPAMQETGFNPWVGKIPWEGNTTHSSTLAWKFPCTEEPGWLQSIGLQRVGHNWSDLAHSTNKKEQWSEGWLKKTLRWTKEAGLEWTRRTKLNWEGVNPWRLDLTSLPICMMFIATQIVSHSFVRLFMTFLYKKLFETSNSGVLWSSWEWFKANSEIFPQNSRSRNHPSSDSSYVYS